jgi:uroporphyrin-III C-methyltransferase/precorrin-2 dehydrogenase/sirohydrochlorin ferrochelatase
MSELLPLFVNLSGRTVLLVGGGPVAAAKLSQLLAAGATVRVVAPDLHPEIVPREGVTIARRPFEVADLDDVWLVISAATPAVNRQVREGAEARRLFVNAVDDPSNASAFLSGVVRRAGVTLAISTSGHAPGLTALLREALDALLPRDLARWVREARDRRAVWRRDGVPIGDRKPLLLEALNRLYRDSGNRARERSAAAARPDWRGHVSIVGAGPGDPGLLTRAAEERLAHADLVLYDALVDERVVALAGRARRFFVGKRAGRHTLSQADIHAAMIRAARRGRHVVRLKGGDPFVFGRGGEEALALTAAGVSFDVVPGVSSATAAPALAGMPVTHRGVSSALLVISGHDVAAFRSTIGALPASGVTLVILMGMGRRAEIASSLIEHGWPAARSAAIIADASLPEQQVWRGTIGDLQAGRGAVDGDGPAAIVVGEVAALNRRNVLDSVGSADRAGLKGTTSASGSSGG